MEQKEWLSPASPRHIIPENTNNLKLLELCSLIFGKGRSGSPSAVAGAAAALQLRAKVAGRQRRLGDVRNDCSYAYRLAIAGGRRLRLRRAPGLIVPWEKSTLAQAIFLVRIWVSASASVTVSQGGVWAEPA